MTRGLLRGMRLLGNAIIATVAIFCVLLLAIRFVVYPNIGEYREQIASRLSIALGAPVAVGGLEGGWDGWNPRLTITDFLINDRQAEGAVALRLPRVDLTIAWTSLATLDLRLKELSIDQPQLAVRRDRQGHLHVAGLKLNPDASNDDSRFTDWLLRQRQIVVRDALLIWDDELREVPQLVLDHVMFRIERRLTGHRFRLVGEPPAELASPIDFRGEVVGGSIGDWRSAKGNFYVRLDYADVGLWREWIPTLRQIESGKGALRMWFDFAGGRATSVVADVELSDVRTRFADDLPKLDLAHLTGRLRWKHDGSHVELAGRGLSFRMREGQALEPAQFLLRFTRPLEGEISDGTMTFDRVDVAPLAALARHLPIPAAWRRDLTSLDLRGSVSGGKFAWDGPASDPRRYSGSGAFAQFGISASAASPGASGVSGSFEFDEVRGGLKLDSRDMRVVLPRLFADALEFSSASGQVGWSRSGDQWRFTVADLKFVGPHTSGSARGSWQSSAKGPGIIDLKAQIPRGEAQYLWRYLPLTLDAQLSNWLRYGIKDGTARDVTIAVTGDLKDFPFANADRGEFKVTFGIEGATLDYADNWPALTGIDGVATFAGRSMLIEAQRARVFGVQIGPVTAGIADLGATHPLLRIDGRAAGPTADFLAFVKRSPVAAWVGSSVADAKSNGNGELMLAIELPLIGDERARIRGDYTILDNQLAFGGVPNLTRVSGKIAFTDDSVRAKDIVAEALGGSLRVGIAGEAGELQITAEGKANLATLREHVELPMLGRISGNVAYRCAMKAGGGQSVWTMESDLKGADLAFPAPIGKTPDESALLRIRRADVRGKPDADVITVDYREGLRTILQRRLGSDGATLERAVVLLGPDATQATSADRPGMWIRGRIADLDVDEWLALNAKENSGGAATSRIGGLALQGIDITTGRMDIFGRAFHDMSATAQRGSDGWRLRVAGREVEGTATWVGSSPALPGGQFMARLSRFQAPGPDELHPARSEIGAGEREQEVWPKLDIVADSLVTRGGNDLGKFELLAQPAGPDWRISKMSLSNPAGRIDASGWWRVLKNRQNTKMDIEVVATEAGQFLQRFGYPAAVRRAPSTIRGHLEWSGAPNQFDYPTLDGEFRLETGAGQFTKIDPGIGKLLGVLSLQALPRRITLDFSDVFSEGFAFEDIIGDFRIQGGKMHTDNLRLQGPAATVKISGDINLAAEQQRLNVRVQPALSTSVSAGAAVLFLANPLIGAAVGAGALLAQQMLDNPIGQIFSYDYLVTGGWSDPQVERVQSRAPEGAATPGGEAPTR